MNQFVFWVSFVMFLISIGSGFVAVKKNLPFHAKVQLWSAVTFIVAMYLA